jgi:hypothetical protein
MFSLIKNQHPNEWILSFSTIVPVMLLPLDSLSERLSHNYASSKEQNY